MRTLILGAGGFAREVALVLNESFPRPIFYLSDDEKQYGRSYEYGVCVSSIENYKNEEGQRFIPGLGSPTIRKMLVERALAKGWSPTVAISPKAFLPRDRTEARFYVGDGSVICSGVSGTVNVTIGRYVNINLNCTLGHDSTIGDYANLSPGIRLSGHVKIGKGADLGTGAIILPGVEIGENSVIGAGSVVTRDIPPNVTAFGVPCRVKE